jgi:hypothetical protein
MLVLPQTPRVRVVDLYDIAPILISPIHFRIDDTQPCLTTLDHHPTTTIMNSNRQSEKPHKLVLMVILLDVQ